MEAETAPLPDDEFWRQGLDRMFFNHAYKRASIIGAVLALMAVGLEQKSLALGLVCGLGVAIFSTWTVEVTVRLLFNGGDFSGVKLAVAAAVKFPFLLAVLLAIAWAADKHILNIFAVVVGVLLLHGTMLVMALATAMAHRDRLTERYR